MCMKLCEKKHQEKEEEEAGEFFAFFFIGIMSAFRIHSGLIHLHMGALVLELRRRQNQLICKLTVCACVIRICSRRYVISANTKTGRSHTCGGCVLKN